MNLELPRSAVLSVAAFAAVSVAVLLVILGRLGALPLTGTKSRTARVVFANAEGLPAQAEVLVHGVKVGSVTGIAIRRSGSTLVTISLGSAAPLLHRDAAASVGFKTPLGEPFLNLDPGHRPGRLTGMLHAQPTVEIDDALAFLNSAGRANARAALGSLGRATSSPQAGSELSGTVAQLEPTTASLDRLTQQLSAQSRAISSIVTDGRVVLGALSSRSSELHSLTETADTTLSALAAQRSALAATLRVLPRLLRQSTSTLAAARPLIERAIPLAGAVGSAAPSLTSALDRMPIDISAADQILAQAPALRSQALPALILLRSLAGPGSSALSRLGPALADMIPVARYLGPRGRTIAAWFANTAALGDHGDAKGDWARFFVLFDRSTLTGQRASAPPGNSYTAPSDAAHNQPYRLGGYSRLEPYWPALAPRK